MSESKTGHTLPKDTILDERYVIIRKIGEGGMGEVYLALDKRTSREVAVKLLRTALANDDIDQKRFIQESKICAKIRHENVVEVIDAFCHEGFPCFAMEYVDGHSLRTLFDQKQSWKTTVPVLIDTLDAIHAAHELGILHRDLKPSNIFISRDGTVKVGDWGIAKITNDTTGMTKTGMILGTPHYLAPERIVDGTSFTQSDIYAVGCMLHEAVSGSPPFLGKLCDVVNSQIFKIPTIPPHTPEELKKFMLKLLVKDVQKRPSNALKVQEELSAIYEKILSVDPNNEEDLDASGFSTYKLNKSGLSPNATRHNIGRSKAVKTEKIQSNKSCIQKSVLNKSAIRKSAINKSAIIPVSNAGKGSEKSSVKRMSFALILLALCAFIIYSTVLREDQSEKIPMEKLLSRAYAVDFEAIELRYDSRLKSKFTFKMFKITQSAETEDQNIFLEGTINFNDPLLSSGRTNSIRISLPAPCYRDISLHIGEAPPKIFKIDMNPIYMEGFKPIIEIENNTLQTLSQKLSLLRGIHEMDDKKPFIEAIEEKGLTKKVLDRLEVIVPQYLSYINYSTSPYSDEAEVLTTLRKLSPFLAQGDIHPLFGLASKKMGFIHKKIHQLPKAGNWELMSLTKFKIDRPDKLIHYPFIVYKLDELKKQKALFETTADSGFLLSVSISDDHSLHKEDLMSHYETEMMTKRDFLFKGEWPPARARLDLLFTVYDINTYFSVMVNGNKPIYFFKTWDFAPRIGQRVFASASIPVSWLNNDKNYIDVIPGELIDDGKIELLQTMLIKSRLRVQFDY